MIYIWNFCLKLNENKKGIYLQWQYFVHISICFDNGNILYTYRRIEVGTPKTLDFIIKIIQSLLILTIFFLNMEARPASPPFLSLYYSDIKNTSGIILMVGQICYCRIYFSVWFSIQDLLLMTMNAYVY
jgi:hypothetical protein